MDDWVTVTSANQLVRGRGYFVCWRKKQSNNCKNNRMKLLLFAHQHFKKITPDGEPRSASVRGANAGEWDYERRS